MYAAWAVVQKTMPRLPPGQLLRQQWLRLLGAGELDALAHPERFGAVLDVLWQALGHSNPMVRRAAVQSLSQYRIDLVEKLDAARPLTEYIKVRVASERSTLLED